MHVPAAAPVPNSELEAMASRGLQAAMTEVNAMHAISYLYRPTRASVKRVSVLLHVVIDCASRVGS